MSSLVFRAIENRTAYVKGDLAWESVIAGPDGVVRAETASTDTMGSAELLVADVPLGPRNSLYLMVGDVAAFFILFFFACRIAWQIVCWRRDRGVGLRETRMRWWRWTYIDHVASFLNLDGPLVIAHRGGAALACENSDTAFARSVGLGVRVLRVRHPHDRRRVPILHHDADLTRVAHYGAKIEDIDWDEISGIRLPDDGRLMRLDEALTAWPGIRWNLDVRMTGRCSRRSTRCCGPRRWTGSVSRPSRTDG